MSLASSQSRGPAAAGRRGAGRGELQVSDRRYLSEGSMALLDRPTPSAKGGGTTGTDRVTVTTPLTNTVRTTSTLSGTSPSERNPSPGTGKSRLGSGFEQTTS